MYYNQTSLSPVSPFGYYLGPLTEGMLPSPMPPTIPSPTVENVAQHGNNTRSLPSYGSRVILTPPGFGYRVDQLPSYPYPPREGFIFQQPGIGRSPTPMGSREMYGIPSPEQGAILLASRHETPMYPQGFCSHKTSICSPFVPFLNMVGINPGPNMIGYRPQMAVHEGPNQGPVAHMEAPNVPQDIKPEEEKHNPAEEVKDLSDIPDEPPSKKILGGNAYKRRNVYKFILRQMGNYISKCKEELWDILKKKGYSVESMDYAFEKIKKYNEPGYQKGQKNAQSIITKILRNRNLYIYLLRETLNALMINFRIGNTGKTAKKKQKLIYESFYPLIQRNCRISRRRSRGKSC
eukprot:TRINITY_DN1690_c0_g1_i1.p1 TRINITY_DN1690_c0_g1~~TRINITY_DN1690_c0_g1_i1.p1  ORF type:complete len:349 (+),score=46.48 TRINITY_DN1690_c0_g1_i1:38-1084(+)